MKVGIFSTGSNFFRGKYCKNSFDAAKKMSSSVNRECIVRKNCGVGSKHYFKTFSTNNQENVSEKNSFAHEFTIDAKKLKKATKTFTKNQEKVSSRSFLRKATYYSIAFFCLVAGSYYLYISKEIFKKLELNRKFRNLRKESYNKRNLNIDDIDSKFKEFDEKYEINKTIYLKENKVNIGNKELNTEEEPEKPEKPILADSAGDLEKSRESSSEQITLSSDLPDENSNSEAFEQEENVLYDGERTIKHIKGKDYEQTKVFDSESNIDPRIMGNTIIFDSRLNRKTGKEEN